MKKAALLRSYSGKLDAANVYSILSGEKTRAPKGISPQPVKLKAKIYTKYFAPETKPAEAERMIDEALALYFSKSEDISSAS